MEITTKTKETKEEIKVPEFGKFKTKERFLEFVSFKRGLNIIIKEAFISGSQISSMEFEGVKFKLTIKDEGTVDFESDVVDLSDDRKQNLLDMICHDGIVIPYAHRNKYVLDNYRFEDKDGNKFYLSIEVKKPIDKQRYIFYEPIITDEQKNKINQFLDIFGDEEVKEETKEKIKIEKKETVVSEEIKKTTSSQEILNAGFAKMKEDKIKELQKRLEDNEKQRISIKNNLNQYQRSLNEVESDISLTHTRLKTMIPKKDLNGYIFHISEEIKTDVKLDENLKTVVEKISPLLKLKSDAVIDYLTRGKYFIRLSRLDSPDLKFEDKDLKEFIKNETLKDSMKSIDPLGTWGTDDDCGGRKVISYSGDLKYHDLVEGMVKNGFETNHDFNLLFEKKAERDKEESTKSFKEKANDIKNQVINKITGKK